jgi:hypothetical protein
VAKRQSVIQTTLHSKLYIEQHIFSFLCCPIMCLYVLMSSTIPHKTSLTPVVCRRVHVLLTLFKFIGQHKKLKILFSLHYTKLMLTMLKSQTILLLPWKTIGYNIYRKMKKTIEDSSVVFLFCFLRLVYPMMPASLDCPCLIAPFGIL